MFLFFVILGFRSYEKPIGVKKNYFLLLFAFVVLNTVAFGQTTLAAQDFGGSGTWTFTATPTPYDVDSDVWNTVSSLSNISPQSGSTFWGMQDLENGNGGGDFDHTLEFPNVSVSGEVDIVVTFYYYTIGFESADELRVEFFFDDVSQGIELLNENTNAWTLVSRVVPDGTGNVRLTLSARQNGGSDFAGFDNILLRSDAITDPSLTITSPNEGETVNSGADGFNATIEVQNFTVSGDNGMGASDNTRDGFIRYAIDGGTRVNTFDTGAITLTGLSSGVHSLYVELVDNSGAVLSPEVNATVNFTVNNILQSLPFFENFNYTVGENLGDQPIWQNQNSGDEIVIDSGNLTYSGLAASTGNRISFSGSGQDPKVEFDPVTSGEVYASFIFRVTDQSSMTDLVDGGYFAILGDFDGRLWVRPNPDVASSTFDIGAGAASSSPPSTSPTVYNVGDDILVVLSYNIDTDVVSAWVNPTSADLDSSSPPAPTLTDNNTANVTSINKFTIRQDSGGETPALLFDELRIGTSWDGITPNTLSNNTIREDLFSIYPNPASSGYVNISATQPGSVQVSVFDILGKQIKTEKLTNNRLNVTNLNTGVYILKITQDQATITRKLVIR